MKKIIYTRPDGGTSVIHPIIGSKEILSEDQAFERAKKDIPSDASNVHVVEEHHVPKDRSKRHLWGIEDGKIVIKE